MINPEISNQLIRATEQNNIPQFNKILDRLLLDKSFDLNGVDKYGRTLLGIAVEDRRLEIISILLDRGVNVNSSDYALHLAIEYPSMEIIDLLLDRGANIDRLDSNGYTPILLATSDGNEEISMRLIIRGANLNIANDLSLKPIHYALAWDFSRVVNLLELSVFEILEERLFLELDPKLIVERTPENSELLKIKHLIYKSEVPLLVLINFFVLPQLQQSAISPQLDTVAKFDFRDGDVLTNSTLDVFGCGYEQLLRNLEWWIENEIGYSQPIFRAISHAALNICNFIYVNCENSKSDTYFENNALSSDLFSVIRYLSRFIQSHLDIKQHISTYDLKKSIDYYLHL